MDYVTHQFNPWKAVNGTRQRTSDANWKKPLKWNRKEAVLAGPFDSAPSPSNPLKAGMNGIFRMHPNPMHGDGFTVHGTVINTSTGLMVDSEGGGQFASHLFIEFAPERPRIFPSLCDPWESWDGPMVDHEGMVILKPYLDSESDIYDRCWPEDLGNDMQGWQPITMSDCRRDFFSLIDQTPNLDYLLLTKRPENIRAMIPHTDPMIRHREGMFEDAREAFYRRNCWFGYSASDQPTFESGIGHLLACRDLTPVLMLSAEPLLGPMDLWPWLASKEHGPGMEGEPRPDLVIVGGESGNNARPCNIEWIWDIRRQCKEAGVACWVKQLGSNSTGWSYDEDFGVCMTDGNDGFAVANFKHPAGADPDEWPEDLRVQEMPQCG